MGSVGMMISTMAAWLMQAGPGQGGDVSVYAVWAVVLIAVALLLFVLEVFVPSGGVIGFFSAASLIAGIVMLFKFDTVTGLLGAIVALGSVPFLFLFVVKVLPHTPIARMLTLGDPVGKDAGAEGRVEGGVGVEGAALVGRRGRAVTDLHPVGFCVIEGRRVSCLAEGQLIRSGSAVRVVSADGMEVKVRPDGEG